MERIYTIPLRKKTVPTARYKRGPKAMRVIRQYLEKHMKSDNVKIDKEINEFVWTRGIKHPPSKVKVKAIKDDTGKVTATLEKEEAKPVEKKAKPVEKKAKPVLRASEKSAKTSKSEVKNKK